MVGMSFRRSGRDQEAPLDVQEGAVGLPGGSEGVKKVGRLSRRSGSGREGLPKVQEAILEIWKKLGGPAKGPGVVRRGSQRSGRTFWRSGSGREGLPKVQEAIPKIRKKLKGSAEGPGVVERASCRFGRPFQKFGKALEGLPEVREG